MDSRKVEAKLLIVVVAKEPIPGKVKTRLSPQLSPGEAASLYRCFLEDKIGEMMTRYNYLADRMKDYPNTAERMCENYYNLFVELLEQREEILKKRRWWRRPGWLLRDYCRALLNYN